MLAAGTLVAGETTGVAAPGDDTPAPAATKAVAGRLQHPVLVSKPPLVYPAIARPAHASGPVRVRVLVGKDGRVVEAHATSGPFLLLFAAEDAIRSWRYKPALLDKEPVEATTYVTVNFTITRP
jgi:protein TonB